MAAVLQEEFGNQVDTSFTASSGGVFDVIADGQVVFSKHAVGRFPSDDEVVDAVAARKKG